MEDSAEAFDPSAAADSTGGAKGERKRQSALSESDMDSSQSDDSSAYSGLSGSDDYDSEDDLEQQKRTREKSSQKLKEAVAAPDLTTAAETVRTCSACWFLSYQQLIGLLCRFDIGTQRGKGTLVWIEEKCMGII